MRLGGPVFEECGDPQEWVAAVRRLGYGAAYCPVGSDAPDGVIRAYAQAARDAGIVIAEVGAWSNPISPDEAARREALDKCRQGLRLADEIGARCCVNIAGSRGARGDGHDPANLTDETFDLIVETTRSIIDAVRPRRAFYTLETMPWMYPDSAESYLRLLEAIDRKQFGVHFDPVNLVCSPQRYFGNGALIADCMAKLGAHIRSCHAKDVILDERFLVHLDEVRPGLGGLDYRVFLGEVARLDRDTPVMLEHLDTPQEYALAAEYLRRVAAEIGVHFR